MIIQFSVEISVTGYRQIQETGAHRTHMKLVFCRPLMKKQIIETSDNHIPVRTLTTGLQPFSRKEFHVHSGEVLSSHDEANWISTSDTLARFFRKRHIHHLLFQFGSQRTVLFLPSRTQKHFHQGFHVRAFTTTRFTFVVYGLEWLVRVWFVSIVLDFVVACWFGCFSSPILAVLLYIFLYVSFA